MRPGDRFFIGAFVYNAGPDLLMQMSPYRAGKLVYRSKKEPIQIKTDPASGARPIAYTVDLAVQDPAAPKRSQFAFRAVDFTVK